VIALSEQEARWIGEVADRLRLIQADAAPAPAEQRQSYLDEELARRFTAVAPGSRNRLLQALLAHFPVAGQVLESPAPPQSPVPEAKSFDAWLGRFLEAWPQLPEAEREQLSKRLAAAGWVRADAEQTIADEHRQALGLRRGTQPALRRLAELSVMLVDLVQRLDERALDTMRDLSPNNPLLRRTQDLRNAAGLFLTKGDPALEAQVRMISSLFGGLLVAIQGGGKEFGHQYLERFSPTAIEEVVAGEGGKLWGPSTEELCWRKYVELAEDLATADLIDRQIKESLAAYVKKKGLGQ
jgi:hypothetical protein